MRQKVCKRLRAKARIAAKGEGTKLMARLVKSFKDATGKTVGGEIPGDKYRL